MVGGGKKEGVGCLKCVQDEVEAAFHRDQQHVSKLNEIHNRFTSFNELFSSSNLHFDSLFTYHIFVTSFLVAHASTHTFSTTFHQI
jgi:hypothetical protein